MSASSTGLPRMDALERIDAVVAAIEGEPG
jgi:hypothetical protein